jgi:hypothetical protein
VAGGQWVLGYAPEAGLMLGGSLTSVNMCHIRHMCLLCRSRTMPEGVKKLFGEGRLSSWDINIRQPSV